MLDDFVANQRSRPVGLSSSPNGYILLVDGGTRAVLYLFGGGWFAPLVASRGRPCGRSRGAPAPRAPLGWGPASPASLASSLTVGPSATLRASGTAVAAYRRHFLSATCVQRARRHGSCWSLQAAWQE